jgi:SAM-dependent methyltransferase
MRPLRWTPELVRRFWDGIAETRGLAQQSFGRLGGRYLLQAVRWHLVPGQRHLDFGGGDGDFAALLAEEGYPTAVWEPSPARAARVEAKLEGQPGFLGTIGPETQIRDQGQFDTIFLVEVIEHVLEDELPSVLAQLDRLLAPGGKLVISTPNDEDLEQNFAFEPEQGVLFHRWQHQRRFVAGSLTQLLAGHGFQPLVVHELELSERIFAAQGAGLGCRPDFANLFNTDRSLTIGDGHNLVWIGGRAGEIAAAGERLGLARLTIPAETRLVLPDTPTPPALPIADRRCPKGWREILLQPEQMFPDRGSLYGIALPPDLPPADTDEAPMASALRCCEDGMPLGPGHTIHERIAALGHGRYSHWGGTLFFSASDNSDPRRNGRRYTLRWRKRPAPAPHGPVRFLLPPSAIEPWIGPACRVLLPDTVPPGDLSDDDRRSTLGLVEDHLPLGPAHAGLETIMAQGRGQYRHHGNILVFSASDGSDPRRNGRRYRLDWA